MKSLKNYITEAFKISKNTKLEKVNDDLTNKILNVIQYSGILREQQLSKHKDKCYYALLDFFQHNKNFTDLKAIRYWLPKLNDFQKHVFISNCKDTRMISLSALHKDDVILIYAFTSKICLCFTKSNSLVLTSGTTKEGLHLYINLKIYLENENS